MSVYAIIPARLESSRFPNKVLARDTGKFLIQHVHEQVSLARKIDHVIIATDDQKVAEACDSFGATWQLTDVSHTSGTDRIAQVARDIDLDIVINVQGDEPEINPKSIDTLVELILRDPETQMATLVSPMNDPQLIANPNIVKVIVDQQGDAIYFSRSQIPYQRTDGNVNDQVEYLRHIGMYAYRKETLLTFSELPATPLEKAERLEQLRALEHGIKIAVGKVSEHAPGIDTPEQYQEFVNRYEKKKETSVVD